MQFNLKTSLLAVALPVLATACVSNGGNNNFRDVTPQKLQHNKWELVSINGEQIQTNNHQTAPFIEIGANLETSGNTGCNNFKGTGELGERKFRVNRMAMTRKMCPGNANDIEKAVFNTLSDWSEIAVPNNLLIIQDDENTLEFKRAK